MSRALPIALAAVAIVAYSCVQRYLALRRQIAIAKTTNIPYIVLPFNHIGNFWTAFQKIVLPLYEMIPGTKNRITTKVAYTYFQWYFQDETATQLAPVFLVVSPYGMYISSRSAEFNSAITARKSDFLKPVHLYHVVEVYGKNMLSSEGEEWKRHRRIVGPSFNEKSNALVFEESVRQARGLLNYLATMDGNSQVDLSVGDVAPHMAMLALHVICGAAFGVPQTWPGEDESVLGTRTVPGFNTKKLNANHKLPFKYTVDLFQDCFLWVAVLPMWLIKILPMKITQEIYASFLELSDYFIELVEYKFKRLETGETDTRTMDVLKPLVSALNTSPGFDEKPAAEKMGSLSLSEITGNAFVVLFAGHETSANILHFCMVFLAMNRASQHLLHADIDDIVGKSDPTTWTYAETMNSLFNSMVGATQNETLRLMPPVVSIPKHTLSKEKGGTMQTVIVNGEALRVPPGTFMHMDAVGTARDPQNYPHRPSKLTGKTHDLNDFVPERWLLSSEYHKDATNSEAAKGPTHRAPRDGSREPDQPDELESMSSDNSSALFRPAKGAFIPFSEGPRGCPGRRFAQVEITAVLAAVFQEYSVELDVREWASDEEVKRMTREQRRDLYTKAIPLDLISVNDSMVSQLPDLKNTPENTPGPHCMIISPSRSSIFVESWPSAAHVVMSASQRAQELRKFYAPFDDGSTPGSAQGINQSILDDGALGAYAELILWRLRGTRAMVSLIDNTTEYFVAGVSRSDNSSNEITISNDWFGCNTIETPGGLCENVMAMDGSKAGYPCFEVSDLHTHPRYEHQPVVNGVIASYKYYAGTPITTAHGVNIGSLFMFDDESRPNGLTVRERKCLFETAENVMKHLQSKREAAERRRVALMSTGVAKFLERTTWLGDADTDSNPEFPLSSNSLGESEAQRSSMESTNITSQTSTSGDTDMDGWPKKKGASEIVLDKIKKALDHAAYVLRESLELTAGGVVFLDTAIGPSEPKASTDYFDPIQPDLDSVTSGIGGVDFEDELRPENDLTMTGIDPKSTIPSGQVRGFYDEYRPVRVPALSCSKHAYRRSRALDGKTLQDFIDMYPKGNIWYIDEKGYFSSLDQDDNIGSPQRTTPMEGRRSIYNIGADSTRQAAEATILSKVFQGARQIIFLPLWDASGNRWHSGCFVWSNNSFPVFTVDSELAYISALSNSVMVEISRLDSIMANNVKSDFISSISHEFRSPLHGILASAEFLHDSDLDQTQDQLVASIRTCGSALLDTINHVLDYSKINSFQKKNSSGSFSNELDLTANVALLCERVIDGLIATRGYTGVSNQDTTADPDSPHDAPYAHPVEIILDFEDRDWMFKIIPGALRRIIMNTVSNAMKFTNTGFVLIQLRVKQADGRQSDPTSKMGQKILALNVIDSGRGMSKQYMERKLYTPFAQEDPFIPGVGLGLSITRNIIAQLGGKINIRSELGKGTDVEVLLPLALADADATSTELSSTHAHRHDAPDREATAAVEGVRALAPGKSVAIWRAPAHTAGTRDDSLAWKTVAGYCKSWFGFTLLTNPDAATLATADVVIRECSPFGPDDDPLPRCTSRVLNLQERIDRPSTRRTHMDSPLSETLSLPIGPFKLALAILSLFHDPARRAALEDEAANPHPVRFPSDETVTQHSHGWSVGPRTPIPESRQEEALVPEPTTNGTSKCHPQTPLSTPPLTLASLSLPVPTRSLHILAVDDNALNLLLLTRYLSKRPSDIVVTARDGLEAVTAVRAAEDPFDVVFMDISMPGMDGFAATRAIRVMEAERAEHAGSRARIVALTGLASKRDREEAERCGFDDFLTKPVSFRLIGRLLEGLSRGDGRVGLEEEDT
ncbi:hypothetical protein V500_06345 [Pseudogymnoascus sp. VKM F-4518 (FW-2643)]|nr:hypothetical protein V500_06345 [Pseudogymnoascus sp. VKM F-4518 (FW-2643)]